MMVGNGLVMASMFFLLLQIPTTSGNTTNCIDNYNDFVNLTFSHGHVYGTENRWRVYKAFYRPNLHLPFSVIVLYQSMLPNGTTEKVTTDEEHTGQTAWAWISSPVFIVVRAQYLNSLALFTLNHFQQYSVTPITIKVPKLCQNHKYNLLSVMTSQLQGIALGGGQCGAYIGNIDHFHIVNKHTLATSYGFNDRKLRPFGMVAVIGIFLQVLFISLLFAHIGYQVLTCATQKISEYTFDGYGMFWGVSTTAFLITLILCVIDINLIKKIIQRSRGNPFAYIQLAILTFIYLSSLLVVVYIFLKSKPRLTAPWLYSAVFRVLSCGCCKKKKAEVVAGGVACWFILVAVQGLLAHAVFIVLAVLASPTTVPLNVMCLVLLFVCITYTSSLLHTILAYIFTPPSRRQKGRGTEVVRAAILVPLLVTVMFYIILLASSGYMINSDTKQNYYPSLIASAFGTVAIGLMTFGLKWFITAWFKWSPNNTGQHGGEDEQEGYHIILDDVPKLNTT